jgi:uncharacterized phiE125 gp8 family phage protein
MKQDTRRVTDAATEPLSLAEAKVHLRVDSSDEDDYITALIKVARLECENKTQRALITQTWETTLERFTDSIQLRFPPLIEVSSVKYLDESEVEQTLATSVYRVDVYAEPACVIRAYGQEWPTVLPGHPNAVRVRYTAGYGAASAVPAALKQWMLLHIAHWYDNRTAGVKSMQTLPLLDGLLDPYRIVMF